MALVRVLCMAAIALLCALAFATTASAHARYKTSTPDKGEVLAAAPARVTITFTEEIQKVSGTYGIDVTKDGGGPVTAGPATVDDADRTKLSVPLQSTLPDGRYIVTWNNVSDDDRDPAKGAFSFYISTQPSAADLAADKQLETIGAEDETPTDETPGTTVATPVATSQPSVPPPTATTKKDDGGNGMTITIVVIAAIIAGAVVGFAGWTVMSRRRS